jgi:hypothetical protein
LLLRVDDSGSFEAIVRESEVWEKDELENCRNIVVRVLCLFVGGQRIHSLGAVVGASP